MGKIKDRTNQKFNKWTILTFDSVNINGDATWLCECDCGFQTVLVVSNVTTGSSRQCKTCSSSRNYNGDIPVPFWKTFLNNAKNRDKLVDVTKEFLVNLFNKQNKKCALSGLDIYFAKNNGDYMNGNQTASLDRINSNLDYTENNVQWIHKDINIMKNALNEDKFIDYCKSIVDHHNKLTN